MLLTRSFRIRIASLACCFLFRIASLACHFLLDASLVPFLAVRNTYTHHNGDEDAREEDANDDATNGHNGHSAKRISHNRDQDDENYPRTYDDGLLNESGITTITIRRSRQLIARARWAPTTATASTDGCAEDCEQEHAYAEERAVIVSIAVGLVGSTNTQATSLLAHGRDLLVMPTVGSRVGAGEPYMYSTLVPG
eukprot:COSAG05_NODE_8793_length_671_cov_0.634615_1_plen_195_part_10